MTPIRVLIAEDQTILRETYVNVLKEIPNIVVLEAVADGEAVVEAAGRLRPDVVLLDIQMPKLNGIQAAERIRAMMPHVGLVLFSHYSDNRCFF